MILRMGPRCVEIDGEGAGVPMPEIRRVAALFREIFGAEPALRVTGRFGAGARGAEPETPETAQWWAELGAWCPVVHIDNEWLYAQPFCGSTRGRVMPVSPYRGTMVRVRLFLP